MTSVSFTTPHLQKTPLVSAFPVCVCVCVPSLSWQMVLAKNGIAKKETRFPQSPLLKLVRHDPERIDG
jgi:hypothetical protein